MREKTQQKHVNAQQHKTGAKKESKEVFMDSRESRRSVKVRARLQVELLLQRNRFRSRSFFYVYRSAKAHGSEKVSAPEREIKDMAKDDYYKYIKQTEVQKALIKTGYSTIKEKIKTLQLEYRKTVNRGSRSGGGR